MTPFDYIVITAYFCLLLTVGYLTSKFVTNTSDYFRGGGTMMWWLVGSSAFMVQFSAWTFTGAASSAYSNGWGVSHQWIDLAVLALPVHFRRIRDSPEDGYHSDRYRCHHLHPAWWLMGVLLQRLCTITGHGPGYDHCRCPCVDRGWGRFQLCRENA